MIWFFTRDSAQVDIEVRRVPDTGLFELVMDYSDGSETVERFRDGRKLIERTLTVQRRLIRNGWTPTGPGHHRRTLAGDALSRPAAASAASRTPRVLAFLQRQVRERLAATFGL